jgi:hypothetical protein
MAGDILNINICSPLKLRCDLTGNYHAICHYSYNLSLGHLNEPLSYKISSYRIVFFEYLSNKNESYRIKH